MAEIWKGAPVAKALTEKLKARAEVLMNQETPVVPTLAIVRVGERPDDLAYETGAMKRCEKVGIGVRQFVLPAEATEEEVLNVIREVNEDSSIHGCLMFRPLPDKETERAACALLDPAKDVDCMTEASLAGVFTGRGKGYPPCTAQACLEVLDHYGVDLTGKRVTVIGRSLVIGKPVSIMLQQRNATVTMCHTRTVDLAGTCREAEILVSAAGRAAVVTASFVHEGQIIVDVGINTDAEGNLCGDVAFDEVEPIVQAITPVPRGVGSVTTAVLCKHVIEAAEKATR